MISLGESVIKSNYSTDEDTSNLKKVSVEDSMKRLEGLKQRRQKEVINDK